MIGQYNLALVAGSYFVAVLASHIALRVSARADGGSEARAWLAGGAVAMGTGVWSMHFIGMLAFQLPIDVSYDVGLTALSLAIAIVVCGFALRIASRPTLSTGWI